MSLFQLPCESCTKIIPVSTTQSGREVDCPVCGNRQLAPKLGTIRKLPALESRQVGKLKPKKQWSAFQGSVFALGFVLLIAGLIGGGTCFYQHSLRVAALAKMSEESGGEIDFTDISTFQAKADNLNEAQLWPEWKQALKLDLGPWRPTGFRFVKDERDAYWQWFVGYAIVGGVGFVTLLVSFVLPNRR